MPSNKDHKNPRLGLCIITKAHEECFNLQKKNEKIAVGHATCSGFSLAPHKQEKGSLKIMHNIHKRSEKFFFVF